VLQHAGQISLAEGDNVQGRRVVVSADGGRLRLRENKRGAKTKKGRTRYQGAWREPKLLIIYKGPCIFWYKENAEKILMLRALYKAGRWNLLKQMANSHLSLLRA
jgi:hypothetical protein